MKLKRTEKNKTKHQFIGLCNIWTRQIDGHVILSLSGFFTNYLIVLTGAPCE